MNKDIVLDLIISTEKNSKINKNSFNLPKTKIKKIKSISKEKENSNINNNNQNKTKNQKIKKIIFQNKRIIDLYQIQKKI